MSRGHAPEGYHSVTPYLIVDEPERLIAFCEAAFEAETFQRFEAEGAVMHAEMRIGDAVLMCGRRPPGEGDFRGCIYLYVEDCDATYARAIEAGGTVHREPADQFYGDRSGSLIGPCGTHWSIATRMETLSHEEIQGRMDSGGAQ